MILAAHSAKSRDDRHWSNAYESCPVQRLIRVLEATDPELAAHGRRTARLACDVASHMGLDDDSLKCIRLAAPLHDIGKLFVPRDILDQPGPLSEAQWVELRHHPRMGYELVRDRVSREVATIVLTHHERFDGGGYPDALPGSSIPIEARILQVADAFDAITTTRPYQPALPVDYAVAEFLRCAGTQFDPDAVEAIVTLAARPEWRSAHFDSRGALAGEIAV